MDQGDKKLYRVTLGGRTGKQNPRAGKLFLNWVTEDVILGMFANWQKFSAWALDYKPEYLHGGHLIDRVGYKEFVKHIFEGWSSILRQRWRMIYSGPRMSSGEHACDAAV